MEGVQLLNRIDTKYIFPDEDTLKYLAEIKQNYRSLQIDGVRQATYSTLYYDTPDNLFYLQHHREKPTRLKIRKRQYVDSGLSFLEVKIKSKERTDKQRMRITAINEEFSTEEKDFIRQFYAEPETLIPRIWSVFERITLVNKDTPERLTIDSNIRFSYRGEEANIGPLAIAEVKQEASNRNSTFVQILKKEHVRPMGISKYCIGAALIYPELKHNNFKEKFLHIKRLTNEPV